MPLLGPSPSEPASGVAVPLTDTLSDASVAAVKNSSSTPADTKDDSGESAGTDKPSKATPENAPDEKVQWKIVTVRMPDGTLKKAKKRIKPGEKPAAPKSAAKAAAAGPAAKTAAAGAAAPKSADKSDRAHTSAASTPGAAAASPSKSNSAASPPAGAAALAPETNGTGPDVTQPRGSAATEDAIRAQDLEYKHKRRHRFKNTLLRGVLSSVTSSSMDFPAFEDGDEVLGDDFSGDEVGSGDDGHDGDSVASGARDMEYHHGDVESRCIGAAATAVPPPARAARGPGAGGKAGKVTYKVDERELNSMDEKIAQDAKDKPLQRHWANFSFYFMASLSVILPLLFVGLAIAIACMDGKSASSGWSIIRTPIKIAISAWPIVFAAVVAQAFKTWATFRVERGVKLMELEQLVGSNSFASALKQPFFLRRLNILMLVMLAIWCLSPLGSQALQWIYSLERHSTTEHIDVQYLKRYGTNRVLSSDTPVDEAQLAELVQAVSVYYTGSLMPSNVVQFEIRGSHVVGPYQDQYTHPLLAGAGFYGLPIALPVAKLADAILLQSSTDAALAVTQPMYETLSFPVTASQYKFASCTAFQPKKGSDITDLSFSPSQTLGLGLSFSSSADPSTASGTIRFATRVNLPAAPANLFPSTKDGGSQTPDPTDSSAWDYEYAECTFSQVFITTSITCAANVDTGGGTYSCVADNEQDSSYATLDPAQVDKSWYTNLVDFSDVWAASHANPFSDYAPTTPTERYAEQASSEDGTPYKPDAASLESDPENTQLQQNLATLFNTLVGLGYCPECLNVDAVRSQLVNKPSDVQGLFQTVSAKHTWTDDIIFVVDRRWLAVLMVCTVLLLLVGVGSVVVESRLVAPDVLGYVSTVARNSRYINLPRTRLGDGGAMSGSERARVLGAAEVMMQDVKASADVGKIALGMKHDKAARLRPGRVYR